jgi:hypothetical protein
MEHVEHTLLDSGDFEALVARIARREVDPYPAASGILAQALRTSGRQAAPKDNS